MIPDHFSRDVVQRCRVLLDDLYPIVSNRHYRSHTVEHGYAAGPFTTTFLLSLSMPMLFLPLERIYQPNLRRQTVSDRYRSEELASHIDRALGDDQVFGAAPFNAGVTWYRVEGVTAPDPSAGLSGRHIDALNGAEARCGAAKALTEVALRDLRNALAHGAIHYLDADGRPTEGSFVQQLAFVNRHPKSQTCNIWKVTEEDFHRFLQQWAEWLQLHGLDKAIADAA